MTFIIEKIRGAVTTAATTTAERPLIDLKRTWIATAVLCAFYVGLRVYEQYFHWTAGIDAFSNEFQLYWVSLLYVATMAELIFFLCLVALFIEDARSRCCEGRAP